jgi:hypothetical protein
VLKILSDLAYPSDVFIARFFVESEVPVQSKADIISIQTVGKFFKVEEMLFQGARDC